MKSMKNRGTFQNCNPQRIMRTITQESLNEIIKDNMREFEVPFEEAAEMARDELKAQGGGVSLLPCRGQRGCSFVHSRLSGL